MEAVTNGRAMVVIDRKPYPKPATGDLGVKQLEYCRQRGWLAGPRVERKER